MQSAFQKKISPPNPNAADLRVGFVRALHALAAEIVIIPDC